MKNQNLSKILIVLFSFFVGALAFLQTQNVIAAGAGTLLASAALQLVTGVQIGEGLPSLLCTLAHIKRAACGTPNPGGGRKLWLAPADQFTADWGHLATDAEIQTGPTMAVGFPGWIEVEVSDNSLKLDQKLAGAAGYQAWQNGFEVKVAGDEAAQTAAMEMLVNTEVVGVIELNDLKRKNVGNTLFPLSLEIEHTTGAKGSDQRGWTIKAKNDGLSVPSYFLKSTIALTIAPTA